MWEIFSDGATPYAGVSDVIEYLQKGNRLNQPESCDSEIYRFMQLCWNSNPKQRCYFSGLIVVQVQVVRNCENNRNETCDTKEMDGKWNE
jgi:hypothetical protein